MLASSISQGFGAGWPGVSCRGTTRFTVKLQMSSHSAFAIAIGYFSRCFYSRPIPPSSHGKYVVSICVSTVFQCDGAGWVVAAHRVVMVTLCVRLGDTRGFTLLLGTTP